MAVTVTTFLRDYPEFSDASPDLIKRKIALASKFVNAAAFGDRADDAIKLRAAHFLAMSPPAEEAALEVGKTWYMAEFSRLAKIAAARKRSTT